VEIVLKPIGLVRHNYSDEEVKNSWFGVEGVIEIFEEYVDGLLEIDGFSHLIILAYLHKTSPEDRRVLKIKHRRLTRFGIDISGIPEVGVFASDSPHRPNPIALTIVRFLKRDGNRLYVNGLDLYNETPVLDIKPYTFDRVVRNISVPWWYTLITELIGNKFGDKYIEHR